MGTPDGHEGSGVHRGSGASRRGPSPSPPLADHDVLVRVAYCGVCGTDLHIVFGDGGMGCSRLRLRPRMVGEHRRCWRGIERWCVGDRVVGPASGGFASSSSGGGARWIRRLRGSICGTAALTEPLAVAIHGVTRPGATAADRVLITGGGPIGLLTLAALQAKGLRDAP